MFQFLGNQTERPESPLQMANSIKDEPEQADQEKLANGKIGVASHFYLGKKHFYSYTVCTVYNNSA